MSETTNKNSNTFPNRQWREDQTTSNWLTFTCIIETKETTPYQQ
jgi:hypothetical protein